MPGLDGVNKLVAPYILRVLTCARMLLYDFYVIGAINLKKFIHVDCGKKNKSHTTPAFNSPAWEEVRFDLNPDVKPDVIGAITDMSAFGSESIDAIYSSHNIQRLYVNELVNVLKDYIRILKHDGFCIITCPDIKSISQLIVEDKFLDAIVNSPDGPLAPIDILFGYRLSIARGQFHLAHKCGFTQKALHGTLVSAGFKKVVTAGRPFAPFYDLWALASKNDRADEEMKIIALEHFP